MRGRVTYEGFAAAWPSMTDEQGFADSESQAFGSGVVLLSYEPARTA